MVRLGEVRQLEVDRESLRQPVRLDERRATHQLLCARHQLVTLVRLSVARGLALTRRETAQLLDRLEQLFASLLLQNRAQQTTERAHVAPERRFLRLALARRQLVEPSALILDFPEAFVFAHLARPSSLQGFRVLFYASSRRKTTARVALDAGR